MHISSRIILRADCYHALLQSFRHFLGNFCNYTVPFIGLRLRNYRANLHLHAGTSAVPSANSIVTNDLRVKFRKCWLLPLPRYVKPRIVCKRNDTAFAAGELSPLIHPCPLHRTNSLWLIHSLITLDPLKLITVAAAMSLRLIDRSSISDLSNFPRASFLLYPIIYVWLRTTLSFNLL